MLENLKNKEWLLVTLTAVAVLVKQIFNIEIDKGIIDAIINIIGIVATLVSAITNPKTKGLGK
jgi:uncharacterized membrane protein